MKFISYISEEKPVKDYDSSQDTLEHIEKVKEFCSKAIILFEKQYEKHDNTKLIEPEKEYFDIYTPKLKNCVFGSDEYKSYLKELKVALDHHYNTHRHHPEHFENGIKDMNLLDLLEMLCDWIASTKRMKDGDPIASVDKNQERFGYSDEIAQIFKNTINLLNN